ncbi:hypothetical protein RB595_007503 [Gaeumannomyces hyphopodioides]
MDVTALLNSGAKLGQLSQMAQLAQLGPRGEPLDLTPTPSVISNTTAASTGVATPPPEKSPSRSNSESRTPNRSRTPWDAGGYSLPLTLDAKMIRTPLTAKPVLYSDSPPGEHHPDGNSPSSPKHKFSDSRSSLSSYTTTSSNNSGSHSRISSLSTVSEFQPMTSLITDFSSLEAKMSDETERQSLHNGSSSSVIHGGDAVMRSGLGNDDGMLGAGGMGGGMMDGRLQQPLSPYSMKLEVPGDSGTSHSSENESSSEQQRSDRARSPSDAILFTSNAQPPRGQVVESGRRSIDPFSAGYQPGHKRAVSAPDFPSTVRTRYQPPVGFAAPIVEPPYSPGGFYQQSFTMGDNQPRRPSLGEEDDAYIDDPSASGMQTEHASHSNAAVPSGHVEDWNDGADDANDTAVRAMNDDALCEASDYEDDKPSRCLWGNVPCDTGSQLRKAVSHIFGRNKLCTRQIPDLAWVHFCRKHYQRARYRLGPNYALTQVRLVIRQINKIRKWSDHNVVNGNSSGVVSSWRIQLRKREERRQETKQQSKKRSRDDDDMGGMDGMDGNEDVKAEQPPQWLIEKVGDGYTTEQVLNVAWRLKEDLHNKLYTRIPDVEILPNITSDRTEEAKPRAKAPRRNAPAGQPLRSAPNRSRMGPYAGYQGHRSTLSESARGGMSHLADMASFSGWDSPSKRQRGQEYDGGQLSRPWMTQQATTALPMRPAQDLGSYTNPIASSASGYNYMPNIPQARGSTASYAVQPGGWGAPASTNAGSYGSSMGFATQPQLSPVPTSAAGQAQQSPYFSGSAYASTPAQAQQQSSPAFFSAGAYGGTAATQQSAPRGMYDGWGGYGAHQHHGANTAARSAQHHHQQQQAARSHQRHVSAPWPNSGMMGGGQNSYQFGAAAAMPQFTAGPPMDPALLGNSQQRRSSLPHNHAAAPAAPMMSASQAAAAAQPQAGAGSEHNTGYDMSQHQTHVQNPNARYDFGRR